MRSKAVAVVASALVVAGIAVGSADATNQAYRYWYSSTNTDWMGTRVAVDNPAGSERSISSGDFLLTSVWATNGNGDGNERAVQQGVTYEYKDPENSCDKGASAPAMYYFVELDDYGVYTCYYESNAATTESHSQKVLEDSSGNWGGYLDGTYQGHSLSWSACGGNACGLYAFAEEDTSKAGLWHAKYAGSGNTPWQFYNGTIWGTINSGPAPVVGNYWSGPTGPFPGGIWSFVYSK